LNRKNIRKVRNAIAAADPAKFNMKIWSTSSSREKVLHNCDTAACIGGWAEAVCGDSENLQDLDKDAFELLDLDFVMGDALFSPPGYFKEGAYSQADAVRVLNILLKTGKVDWPAAQGRSA
jgi:hypothetical protein